jgi:hypothetical protein
MRFLATADVPAPYLVCGRFYFQLSHIEATRFPGGFFVL